MSAFGAKSMRVKANVSLAVQVARIIRKWLRTEFAEDGGQLPSEPELAEEFGVSRGTVRQALSILEHEGAIVRRQGVGTYANVSVLRIGARAEVAYEFTELIRDSGFEPEILMIQAKEIPAAEEVAESLKISIGDPVLELRKAFLADREPAIFCVDILPTANVREPYNEADYGLPIFDFLDRHFHLEVSYILAGIVPVVADDELAEILVCGTGDPLLHLEEIGFDADNKPVLFSRIYYKESLIHFKVLRQKM